MYGIKSVKKYMEKKLKIQFENLISSCYDVYVEELSSTGLKPVEFADFATRSYKYMDMRLHKAEGTPLDGVNGSPLVEGVENGK